MGLTVRSFITIIKQPKVLKIISTSAMHTAYLRAVKDYIQLLMVNIALIIPIMLNVEAEKKNGLVIGVIYFFIFLATSRASKLSSKVADSSKWNISYTTLLFGFLFGLICGVSYFYGLWIIAIVAFVGIYIVENIRKPILTGFIADNVPAGILTSVISAQSLLMTILTAILALVFGLLADNFGIGVSLMAVSLFLIVSAIVIRTGTDFNASE